MQKHQKSHWYFNLSLYTFVIIGSLMATGYIFPIGGNFPEVPPIQFMLNPELYKNDYYVQEMVKFNPRYYYYYIIYLLANLGTSIPLAHFIYQFLAFASFILACYAIINIYTNSKLPAAAMAFLCIAASFTDVGNTLIFSTKSVPSTFAMAFAIWGIYLSLRQKWLAGYFCFGLGCVLQFLVGLLPGLMMVPVLVIQSVKQRNFKTLILAIALLAAMASIVYVPMLLTGTTSTHTIDNADFVYIHAKVRNPHHILPSNWDFGNWFNFICFIIGGLLCIKNSDLLPKKDKVNFYVIVGTSIVALFLNYVFVEVYPLAFIAKLQLARTVPFAQIIIFIAVALTVAQLYREKQIAISLLLLAVLTLPFRGIIFLGLSVWQTKKYVFPKRYNILLWILAAGTVIFSLIYPVTDSWEIMGDRIISIPVFFSILAFPFILEKTSLATSIKQTVTHTLALITTATLVFGVAGILPKPILNVFQTRININAVPRDDLSRLAVRFSQISSRDSLVLIPPSVTSFQFFSERAIVVNFKNFPFTEKGIKEWQNRMETVLGVPLNPQMIWGGNDFFIRRSSADLVKVAKNYHADYILTRTDWHPNIQGEIADKQGKWILYKIR
ncbi:hypothetical protein Osc7112_0109 [Oscillatoria nigro-viridis PCC 7112]|uniref:DUF6798 domain-containing protein n=1 Tax=Phormidium nigroviride PCC 7112 TaxID=179408 RepID=K9VA76_9CYAN|nr:DUF6798 domain-containing protein [Oscillatoria nigro-viridis]AFZ04751.1 hypothetical protein Osc7112_0109 [Oscillatoria nigro-viridis PCC 7112]